MDCISVSDLRAVHGFSIFKRQKLEFVREHGTPPLVLKIYFRFYQDNRKWPSLVFGSNYHYWMDFRNSNGIYSGSIEVITEHCCR